MINAVLTSLPMFFMSIFNLPKWVIREIDKVRKKFLWHGEISDRNWYMIAWEKVIKPKDMDGLGVINLQQMNKALLMKWQWHWHASDNNWWKCISIQQNSTVAPWNCRNPTIFWKAIFTMQEQFEACTCTVQGVLTWIKTTSGSFTTKSAYSFLMLQPFTHTNLRKIWSIQAPRRIMVFLWMLLQNRICTIDNLQKKGWQLPNMCQLCRREEETTHHILFTCSLTVQLRNYIIDTVPQDFDRAMAAAFAAARHHTVILEHQTENWTQLTVVLYFVLWKERCRRVFSERELNIVQITREIWRDFNNWFKNDGPIFFEED